MMKDKIVLVAGSGKGTGRTIALAAAASGAAVAVSSRTRADVDSVVDEIRGRGGSAFGIVADLEDPEQARRLVAETIAHFGRIDSLIYNAAWEDQKKFLKIDDAHWDKMLNTNLKGYFVTSQAAARAMVDQQIRGSIVAIASSAGTVAFPDTADYCASKGGMIALTKAMAIDLGFAGIRANAVAPGFIDSDSVRVADAGRAGKLLAAIRAFLPSRRFADQEEIAAAAIFLASDASAYCNGSVLAVDGGMTLGNLPGPGA